ncbi:hypothetical protein BDF21DRAFT_435071 [Thamnidium elegans]|nr:hypothetical protein BDF21DRAFT_435071 [Thamnidium elegans]
MISCRTGRKEISVISFTVKQTLQLHNCLDIQCFVCFLCGQILLRSIKNMYP